MQWIKAFHIIFMVTWYAGLFYLPRLFVYHANVSDQVSHERFCTMEWRLFIIMTIGALLTIAFGVWLVAGWFWPLPEWLQIKLGLVLLLVIYHSYCFYIIRRFADHRNNHSDRFFRIFNEIPSLILIAIVILAVVRPG